MKKYKTYLPVFPGFYGTIFEPSEYIETDSINDYRKSNGLESLNSTEIDFDYEQYELDTAKQCCSIIESNLQEIGIVSGIVLDNIYSPKEYNFHNDSINITVKMDVKNRRAIQQFILEHQNEFSRYLERYTSCSGFISSYSNLVDIWAEETGDFYRFDNPSHYLGSVLQFICEQEFITEELLYDSIDNELYCLDFDFEASKVKCKKCGDWYTLLSDYRSRINIDMAKYGKDFTPISFDSWLSKQVEYSHCE